MVRADRKIDDRLFKTAQTQKQCFLFLVFTVIHQTFSDRDLYFRNKEKNLLNILLHISLLLI